MPVLWHCLYGRNSVLRRVWKWVVIMASYKQACIHCGGLIDADSRFCIKCGKRNPFSLRCPFCLREVAKDDMICGGCGKSLVICCPKCGKDTSAYYDECQMCGTSLLVPCTNSRCGEMEFFKNTHCRACGKKIGK